MHFSRGCGKTGFWQGPTRWWHCHRSPPPGDHGWAAGTEELAQSISVLSQGWMPRPGVISLQAELSVFVARLGPVSSPFYFFFPSGDLLICNRKVRCFPVWYFFDYLKRNPRGLFSQNSDCIIDVIMMYFAVSLLLGWLFWEALSAVNAAMCCVCVAEAFTPSTCVPEHFKHPFLQQGLCETCLGARKSMPIHTGLILGDELPHIFWFKWCLASVNNLPKISRIYHGGDYTSKIVGLNSRPFP